MPFLATLFSVPSATSTLNDVGPWSGEIFSSLFPVIGIVAGLLIGGMLVGAVLSAIVRGAKKVVPRHGRRGRRR